MGVCPNLVRFGEGGGEDEGKKRQARRVHLTYERKKVFGNLRHSLCLLAGNNSASMQGRVAVEE